MANLTEPYRLSAVLAALPALMAEPDCDEYFDHWLEHSKFVQDQPLTWLEEWHTTFADAEFLSLVDENNDIICTCGCAIEILSAMLCTSRGEEMEFAVSSLILARAEEFEPETSLSWIQRIMGSMEYILYWADACGDYVELLEKLIEGEYFDLAVEFAQARAPQLRNQVIDPAVDLPDHVFLALAKFIRVRFTPLAYGDATLISYALRVRNADLLANQYRPFMRGIVDYVQRCKVFTLIVMFAGDHLRLRRRRRAARFFKITAALHLDLQEYIVKIAFSSTEKTPRPLAWSREFTDWAAQ